MSIDDLTGMVLFLGQCDDAQDLEIMGCTRLAEYLRSAQTRGAIAKAYFAVAEDETHFLVRDATAGVGAVALQDADGTPQLEEIWARDMPHFLQLLFACPAIEENPL